MKELEKAIVGKKIEAMINYGIETYITKTLDHNIRQSCREAIESTLKKNLVVSIKGAAK